MDRAAPAFDSPALRPFQLTDDVTTIRLKYTLVTRSGRILHATAYPRDMRVTDRPAIRVQRDRFRDRRNQPSPFAGAFDVVTIELDWSEVLIVRPVDDEQR